MGGIQLFLDLTRAFDALPRPVLAAALSNVKLTPQLQSILLAWHIGTNYNIEINNTARCIPVSRGVRQGCCLAPYLWSTAMVLLLNELQDTIPLQWIKDHISIYADDLHIFCLLYNEQDLSDCIYCFEAVIMAIDRMGLKLSPQKSCVLLKGKGPGFLLWKKRHCVTSKTTQPCLSLRDGSLRIPIMKKCLYLGAVMSYDDFQKQTVAVRVNAGWNNFRRLQPWLSKRNKVSLRLRLQVMNTCIIPTVCYGIFYTGLTSNCIDTLCKILNVMYRRILGHVPHLQHINTRSVLDANNIPHPLLTLQRLVDQAHYSTALTQVPETDIIQQTLWTSLEQSRTTISQRLLQPEGLPTVEEEAPPLVCGFCSFHTTSTSKLQKHLTTFHSRPRLVVKSIDFTQDTVHGKASCSHCHKTFRIGEVSKCTDNTMFATLPSWSMQVFALMPWCTWIRICLLSRWLITFLMQTFLQEPRLLPQKLTMIVFVMTDPYVNLWRQTVSCAPSMRSQCDLWLHIFDRIILDRCKRP